MTDQDKKAPVKIKGKDIKEVRARFLIQQEYKCALCKQPCTEEQAVLDHHHGHGGIRATLHRACNAAEGKILNTLRRFGIKDPDNFLMELVKYHALHEENITGLIHPVHKSPEEKKELLKKRQQRKAKAKKAAKIKNHE